MSKILSKKGLNTVSVIVLLVIVLFSSFMLIGLLNSLYLRSETITRHTIIDKREYFPPQEKIIHKLNSSIIKSLSEQTNINLVTHAFTIDKQNGTYISVFESEGKSILIFPKIVYIVWVLDEQKIPKVKSFAFAPIRLIDVKQDEKIIEEGKIKLGNGTEVNYRIIQREFTAIASIIVPDGGGGGGNATTTTTTGNGTQTIYVLIASTEHTWMFDGYVAIDTWANGTFYVKYGEQILSVIDHSDWINWFVVKCSFNSSVSGVGTVAAQVNADGYYFEISGCPEFSTHLDSHPRVSVDAWLKVDHWSFGNKWFGACSC
jgi:hypothetical protein